MIKRVGIYVASALSVAALVLVPSLNATATSATSIRVQSLVAPTLNPVMPIVRLHFNTAVNASQLPALSIRPFLATKWQQIGSHEVQAVATGRFQPLVGYTVMTPATMRCAKDCTFTSLRALHTNVATNVTWEEQLLAEAGYLPVGFTPAVTQSDPSLQSVGTFSWLYAKLPKLLSGLWQVGTDNVLVTGALMTFQSQHNLPSTGVADPVTWNALIAMVQSGEVNPAPYNYVSVSEGTPETLTLYIAGQAKFHTLVNTGISVAPTALGTYPVYLRYTSQTMSGTNPDGSHYSDPGIPWVSYFNGGDALHGFIRSTYGWPQSLGCVEMPFASAQSVWPHTPIGTLVSVTS
ncbi:MAG: L,D-transpeptidase family protein [Acidimicrobiales bacterium]